MRDPFSLQDGDTVRLRRLTHVGDKNNSAFTYAAAKGKVFVLVMLGTEPADGEGTLDRLQAMRRLGWVPGPELQAELDMAGRT